MDWEASATGSVYTSAAGWVLDLFLADWVLGRSSPEDAVQRAIEALDAGCINPAVAIVAGTLTAHPTRSEIDPQLAHVLHELGRRLPSPEQALKLFVDDCVQRIVDARTDVDDQRLRNDICWSIFDCRARPAGPCVSMEATCRTTTRSQPDTRPSTI